MNKEQIALNESHPTLMNGLKNARRGSTDKILWELIYALREEAYSTRKTLRRIATALEKGNERVGSA